MQTPWERALLRFISAFPNTEHDRHRNSAISKVLEIRWLGHNGPVNFFITEWKATTTKNTSQLTTAGQWTLPTSRFYSYTSDELRRSETLIKARPDVSPFRINSYFSRNITHYKTITVFTVYSYIYKNTQFCEQPFRRFCEHTLATVLIP